MSQTTFVTKSLAADGGASGILTVDSNALFVPGCLVYLASSALPIPKTLKVRALIGSTQFTVYDPASHSFFTNFDASAYLTTDSATVTQPPQANVLADDNGIESPLTTKGDVYSFSTAPDRFPVGADGDVLTADSTQAFGLAWGAAGGSGIASFGAVGASPSANGATVSGGVATLQPADASHPGLVTALTQTLAGAKTFTGAAAFSASVAFTPPSPLTPVGATQTVNFATGSTQILDITGASASCAVTLSGGVSGGRYKIQILGAVAKAVTWATSVKWPAGVAPVITASTGAIDIITLDFIGTQYYGTFSQAFA